MEHSTCDYHSYCTGDWNNNKCLIGASRIDAVERCVLSNQPNLKEYNAIEEDETIVFHGTDEKGVCSIMLEGFMTTKSQSPSIGNGTYTTTCIKTATALSVSGLVFICKAKLGKTKMFDSTDVKYQREAEYNSGMYFNELVIYDDCRLLPIALLECKNVYSNM